MTLRDRIAKIFGRKKTRAFYSGAGTGRLLSNFVQTSKSADSEIKQSIQVLRNRSRDLAKKQFICQKIY